MNEEVQTRKWAEIVGTSYTPEKVRKLLQEDPPVSPEAKAQQLANINHALGRVESAAVALSNFGGQVAVCNATKILVKAEEWLRAYKEEYLVR